MPSPEHRRRSQTAGSSTSTVCASAPPCGATDPGPAHHGHRRQPRHVGAVRDVPCTLDGLQTITYDAPGTGDSTGYRLPKRVPGLGPHDRTPPRPRSTTNGSTCSASPSAGASPSNSPTRRPTRVRRLVLAATMPGLGGIPGTPAPCSHGHTAALHRPRLLPQGRRAALRRRGAPEPHPIARPARRPASSGHRRGADTWPSCTPSPDGRACPGSTACPSRRSCSAGDDDPIVPLVNARILARRIPDARLHVVAGGGHLFIVERADEIAGIVAELPHRVMR